MHALLNQIIRDEGSGPIDSRGRFMPYRDTVGKLTIGYGRNLDDNGIRKDEAEAMLANDLAEAESLLHAYLPWTDGLDEARRGVLLNMAYNMGIHSLLGFKNTLQEIHDGEYTKASERMLESKWAEQVGARANRLSIQMASGVWQ